MTTSDGQTSVIGGVHTEYLKGILTGNEVYTGVYSVAGTKTWEQASFDAWGSYMAARTAADAPVASASGDGVVTTTRTNGTTNGVHLPRWFAFVIASLIVLMF